MDYFRRFRSVSVLTVLVACATPAQNQINSIEANVTSTFSTQKSCIEVVVEDQKFAPLWVHYPSNLQDATLEQLSSTDLATPQDAKLLYELRDSEQPCLQGLVTSLTGISADLGAPFQNYYSVRDQEIIMLSNNKINWGQFVSALVKAREDANTSFQDALDQIGGQLEQENQEEQAQRAQAAANLASAMQAQQAIEQQNLQRQQELEQESLQHQQDIQQENRPVSTNCNTYGTQTQCTSY